MKNINDGNVSIIVSDDGMKAFADITCPGNRGRSVTSADINTAMADAGIVYGIVDSHVISAAAKNGAKRNVTVIVAAGKRPTRGNDSFLELVWKKQYEKKHVGDNSTVDHRELGIVESVKAGENIAVKQPPTFGEYGFTVYGQAVPGNPGMDRMFKPGPNTEAMNVNSVFVSKINGVPIIRDNEVSVSPTFEVEGDVDYSVGNIDFAGTVIIRGDVRDGFSVKAQGDIFIGGHVDAAKVTAGGDVRVAGGIITRFAGYVAAEGSVLAKHITNSIVEAEGNVISYREIVNSYVRANDSVRCIYSDGRITGGDIMARKEISAMKIGSTKETATVLRVGFNFKTYMIVQELEQKLLQVNAALKDAEKYSYSSQARPNSMIKIEESIPALKNEKEVLESEIAALTAAAPINREASVKCENEVHTGVAVFIGENSKRIAWTMRNVILKLDEEYRVRIETLNVYRKNGAGIATGEIDALRIPASFLVNEMISVGVLIIDESDFSRERLREILRGTGFNITGETKDASDALRLYKKYLPEIVIVDIASGNSVGLKAVQDILMADRDASIVLSVGICDMDIMRRAIELGATHFLLKPFSRKNVIDTLNRAVLHKYASEIEKTG